MSKRQNWISVAKLAAIVAVLIDHTYKYCYGSQRIWCVSYYSVACFVFLSGITSFLSLEKHHDRRGFAESLRRVGTVVMPYAVATACYQLDMYKKWDLRMYLKMVANFTASGPFYFVLLIIQLIIIAPLLFEMVKFCKKLRFAFLCLGGGGYSLLSDSNIFNEIYLHATCP
jgi:hypothetical protein